ncbi:MAG: CIA30 family protein [Planctomycetota bacterium]
MNIRHNARRLVIAAASCVAALVGLPAVAGEGCPLCAAAAMAEAGADAVDAVGEGSAAEPAAELLTDFTDADHNAGWRVVNDNVMGGRSIGELSFQTPEGAGMSAGAGEGSMTFEGYINTNGGGFASVRLPLPDETLVGVTAIRLTLQADARPYGLRLEDDRPYRGRYINHSAALPLDPGAAADEVQTVTLPLTAFSPSWRGNAVPDAPALDPAHAVRLGLMLSDIEDGPFRITVERIELVR